jgi:predicted DNA-binding protein (MmcQ/YjbR family)
MDVHLILSWDFDGRFQFNASRSSGMPASPLQRLRQLCLALPGAHEVEAWGEPTFRVNNKLFAMYAAADNHHGAGHHAVWIKSTQVNQGFLLRAKPKRYFSPPYVGPSGWIGVRLDGRVNWKDVADLLRDGYELAAPKPRVRSATRTAVKRRSRVSERHS